MHARSISFALAILCWSYGCIGQPEDGYDGTLDVSDVSDVSQTLRVSTPEDPNPPPPPPRTPPPPPPPPPPTANPAPGPITTLPGSNGDLQLEGTMRYYGGGTPTLGLQIDVTNRGDVAVYGPAGRVIVAGVVLNVALYQYYGGHSGQDNTVLPNERGYLKAEVPVNLLTSCAGYQVSIDIDHTIQTGDASVFANDTATISTICPLTWTSQIDQLHLGYPPAPELAGKTIQGIVSSFVSGRPDNTLCSHCHNRYPNPPQYPGIYYKPNVNQDEAPFAFDPYNYVGGDRGWGYGSPPWADLFVQLPVSRYPHTEALKQLFYKWINDGYGR